MALFTRVAFAGGGSGGHVYPLISVADEMRLLNPKLECFFISTKGSIEEKLVPRAGYELLLVSSGKLKGQGIFRIFKTIFSLAISLFHCFYLVITRRPDFVFSAGGYAGAPYIIAAAILGVPCAILEQNRMPGLANKWMARFCKKIFLNFASSKNCFPGKEVMVVGHPCRHEIEAAAWSERDFEARISKNPFHVFIFGGSQGAVGINRLIISSLPELMDLDIYLHHQTGAQDFEAVKNEYAKQNFKNANVEAYVYDMAAAYNSAHLVVCRAGASSLAELAAAGKACLLIPLVSKDRHQEFNAEEVARLGACETHLQPSLTGEKLAAILKGLYYDRKKLAQYAEKMHALHHPHAAATIAKVILGNSDV